ncbi:hypothetical protein [Brevundimonas sp.]|uniref:hypothetical protein n=1 Tax=Brevundimonas sp. TaxID=1871086 RepID=UPI002ED8CC47
MLIAAALLMIQSTPAPQDAPAATTPVPYAAPSDLYRLEAMPFTPPANFAPVAPQGDSVAESADLRRRLDSAVTVDDYRRSYEQPPSPLAQAYDQGVANAEISADSRMGALDGRWRLLDQDGTELMRILLRDPGDRPIEGAWRKDWRVGPIPAATKSGVEAVLTLPDGVLTLRRTPGGWRGVLKGPDGEKTVTLSR